MNRLAPALFITTTLLLSAHSSGIANAEPPATLTQKPTADCSNGGKLVLKGAYINAEKVAVIAGKGCSVLIEDSIIVGAIDGIVIGGNSRCVIKNSIVYGKKNGIRIGGTSTVDVSGSQVNSGRIAIEASGTVKVKAMGTTFRGKKRVTRSANLRADKTTKFLRAAKKAPPAPKNLR